MGTKASFLPKGDMDKYVVCNADESEPGTFKDRELMQKNPHLLIEGLAIAAYAVGAQQGVHLHPRRVRLRRRRSRGRARGGEGGEPARSARPLGPPGAGAYICGEETALLDALEGKRGNPRLKPPFPAVQGLYRGPDADQQRRDADERADHPADGRRGVRQDRHRALDRHQGRLGLGLRRAARQLRDRARHAVARDHLRPRRAAPLEGRSIKFWFPGGSSAPVLPGTDEYLDLPYDFDSMAKAGSMLGSGAIIVVDGRRPIVDLALKTAKFYRHESCGKCTPCREGTNWTVKMLERIDSGEATPMDLDIMASVCDQIIGNCLCVLGDAMAMPIASMIKHFRPEFEAHIEAARERNGLGISVPAAAVA
jgi:NADH-quinone oxidoreductase subunit F